MLRPKPKIEVVVLKKAQPQNHDRNAGCTCGKVYRNPLYTAQYATCPLHSPRVVDAC